MAARGKALIAALQIEQSILLLRGHRVLLDSTLASLYGVQTKVLVQAVKRNRERFPSDFLLELNKQEVADLRSQIVTSSWGGRRYAPFAFTEQGVAMLSSVLNSPQAIRVCARSCDCARYELSRETHRNITSMLCLERRSNVR